MDVGRAGRESSDRRGAVIEGRGRASSRDLRAETLIVGTEDVEREGSGAPETFEGEEGRVEA